MDSAEKIRDNDEEEYEPQVTSDDPAERKLARALRIQKRIEAIKKQHEPLTEEEVHAGLSLLEQQILKSAESLEKLLIEGDESITNVLIASDKREVDRRAVEQKNRSELLQRLDEEAAQAAVVYEGINDKWAELMLYQDPLDIHESIISQKAKCMELISKKDKVIDELRQEIDKAELEYEKDQREQQLEIDMLSKRISKQVELMRRAYRDEIRLAEKAVEIERQTAILESAQKWDALKIQRDEMEEENMHKKIQIQNEFLEDLQNNRVENEEIFRETKILLENENQVLQQELQHLKAFCLLNTEKLDYNYQVLKKREDENLMIRAQQKRLINRLRDEINKIRHKTDDYKKDSEARFEKLTHEIHSLRNSVFQVEEKAELLKQTNEKRFLQVWEHNEQVAKQLIEEILTVDRIIQEQLLGSEWKYPQWHPIKQQDLHSYRLARMKMDSEKSAQDSDKAKKYEEDVDKLPDTLKKLVIQAISDRAGFLIEKQLAHIVKKLKKDQGNIIAVENVFEAIGIKKEEDMNTLMESFLPYLYCPICEAQEKKDSESNPDVSSHSASDSLDNATDESESLRTINTLQNTMTDLRNASTYVQDIMKIENENASVTNTTLDATSDYLQQQTVSEDTNYSLGSKTGACTSAHHRIYPDHPVMIETAFITKALRDFLHKYNKQQVKEITIPERLVRKSINISRGITSEDMQLFWSQFKNIFPLERENLWEGLIHGLERYHAILEDRHNINEKVQRLKNSNDELKHLLRAPLSAKRFEVAPCPFLPTKSKSSRKV